MEDISLSLNVKLLELVQLSDAEISARAKIKQSGFVSVVQLELFQVGIVLLQEDELDIDQLNTNIWEIITQNFKY